MRVVSVLSLGLLWGFQVSASKTDTARYKITRYKMILRNARFLFALVLVAAQAMASENTSLMGMLDSWQWEEALEMIKKDPSLMISQRNKKNEYPLKRIVCRAPREFVEAFLDLTPANLLLEQDTDGNTIFHDSLIYQQEAFNRRLIQMAPDGLKKINHDGRYPLHEALSIGFENRDALLLDVARLVPEALLHIDNLGNTPVDLAYNRGNRHLALELAAIEPSVVGTTNSMPEIEFALLPKEGEIFENLFKFELTMMHEEEPQMSWELFFAALDRFADPSSAAVNQFGTPASQVSLLEIYVHTARMNNAITRQLHFGEAASLFASYTNFVTKVLSTFLTLNPPKEAASPSVLDALFFFLRQTELGIEKDRKNARDVDHDKAYVVTNLRKIISTLSATPAFEAAIKWREVRYMGENATQIFTNLENFVRER